MITLRHREDCCGCCACEAACPHGAIRMEADDMGFRYPVINKDLCTDCGLCEKICAFKPIKTDVQPKAEVIRFPEYLDKSQSGGLGYALMRKAIGAGYIVYGAAMDADFVVRHRRVDTLEGLEPLRLSKYVQSDMDGIPGQVLADVKAGRRVLFTGTPCQCAGIGSLCAKYRDKLFLADVVCHGVPAPAVWKAYVDLRKKENPGLSAPIFRDPAAGWHPHLESFSIGGERRFYSDYTFLFYQHIDLRPSCYACPFACKKRASDITMCDCWGIERYLPEVEDDDRGFSVLFLHTPAGAQFTRDFEEESVRYPLDAQAYTQPNLEHPSKPHPKVKAFEKEFLRKGLESVIRHYGRDSRWYRWSRFVAKVKRHLL